MLPDTALWVKLTLALLTSLAVSFAATPLVKYFAEKVGAIDVPREARRVHDHPIPRMGGLAIFLGFVLSVVLFAQISKPVQGILIGTIVIVITGAVDDVVSLPAWLKLLLQFAAAGIAVAHGVIIEMLMNPIAFSHNEGVVLGALAVPITLLWIVGITNSVNLIDGLDGLAVGVSAISSVTILIVSLLVSEPNVALVLAALTGACLGFMPYNMNPAKIFMGDTGALLLGFVLSTISVVGLFKFYALVTFAVPFLALAVPLSDTVFAFFRRLLRGQNPMKPDRGHFHHRLIDMGLSQKQAVILLYAVSAFLGLAAVVLAASGRMRVLLLIVTFLFAVIVWYYAFHGLRCPRRTSRRDLPTANKEEPHGSD